MPSPFPAPSWLQDALKKYRRKLGHVRLTILIRKKEQTTWDRAAAAQATLCFFDEKLRTLLDEEGVYSDWHPSYMDYARALWKSQRELTFLVDLIREHQILRDRWERRGLDPTILDRIDNFVIEH